MMKHIHLLAVFIASMVCTPAFSQDYRGLYLTSSDFEQGKITCGKQEGKKFRFHAEPPFHPSFIKIKIGDSTYWFHKDSIYAFKTKKNIVCRIYKRQFFYMLNPTEKILLYEKEAITGEKSGTAIFFFFSRDADGPIEKLTLSNLKHAFPNDATFHEKLDMYFDSDEALILYDPFYHLYKINLIYKTLKK